MPSVLIIRQSRNPGHSHVCRGFGCQFPHAFLCRRYRQLRCPGSAANALKNRRKSWTFVNRSQTSAETNSKAVRVYTMKPIRFPFCCREDLLLADNSVSLRWETVWGCTLCLRLSLELNVANGFVDRINPILFAPFTVMDLSCGHTALNSVIEILQLGMQQTCRCYTISYCSVSKDVHAI